MPDIEPSHPRGDEPSRLPSRQEVEGLLSRLWAWMKGPPPGVLVVGSGGAGKSTLAGWLSGEFDLLKNPPGRYEEDETVDRVRLAERPKFEVVVLPGLNQETRTNAWAEELGNLTKGRYAGLIHVVAYGLNSLRRFRYTEHPLYAGGGKEKFVADYSAAAREEELAVVRQVAESLRYVARRVWMLTVVLKQDLWWPRRAEVENHYRSGPYAAAVSPLFDPARPHPFQHGFVFGSTVINSWASAAGETLVPNVEGYDHAKFRESLLRILKTVDQFRRWGEQS
jgi:hypothetical protein